MPQTGAFIMGQTDGNLWSRVISGRRTMPSGDLKPLRVVAQHHGMGVLLVGDVAGIDYDNGKLGVLVDGTDETYDVLFGDVLGFRHEDL